MSAPGHEQRFPPLQLNVRCRLGQATFIGTDGKGREAPSAVIPALAPERGSSTLSGLRSGFLYIAGAAGEGRFSSSFVSYFTPRSLKSDYPWSDYHASAFRRRGVGVPCLFGSQQSY
jgi:hypothetical protein